MIDIRKLHQQQEENEQQQQHIYEKILYKCHHRIITVSKKGETFSFFVVPEFEFGMPKYNPLKCCHFIIKKLVENGFLVKYTHPNLIFISWNKDYLHLDAAVPSPPSTSYKMLTAPTPPALPPTQMTDHYRPSGKLTTVVRTPNTTRAIEMGGSHDRGGMVGMGGMSGMGGMGEFSGQDRMKGNSSSSSSSFSGNVGSNGSTIAQSILTNPVRKNTSSNMKSISWDPMLDNTSHSKPTDTQKSTLKNNHKNPFKSTLSNNKSTASEFEKSNDLLGNLDVVNINF